MTAKARILVVDDERSMQEFLDIFFRSEGYEVVTAGDLSSALLHLEGDEFDVVVSDIQMPGGESMAMVMGIKHCWQRTGPVVIPCSREDQQLNKLSMAMSKAGIWAMPLYMGSISIMASSW